MGRKKSKIDTEKTSPVSLTLSQRLQINIDEYVDKAINGRTSRSEIVEDICNKYFPPNYCINCRKLIPNDANFCPYCGTNTTVSPKEKKNAMAIFLEDNPQYNNTDDFVYEIKMTDREVRLIYSGETITKLEHEPRKISKQEKEERDSERKKRLENTMTRFSERKKKEDEDELNKINSLREKKKKQKELREETKNKK